ncbi:MAG: ATP synthase F1 subunit delta [Candidatus Limnocylindria bacterium]
MALTGSAARRYAEALMDIATEAKAVDGYRASTVAVADAFSEDFLRVLRDPSRPLEQRLLAAEASTKGQPDAIASLVSMLVRRGRIALIGAIAAAYGELVDERAGIAKARITTAVPFPDSQRTSFVGRLEKSTGKRIVAEFAVEPELIGGATVQVGDHLIDASLRARLDALREQLASA